MLFNTQETYGTKLTASDGEIGHIKDFFFDDKSWVVRYLVVDTGAWLPGRLVLLTPHALGKWDPYGKTLHVNLNRAQIEKSPSIETRTPVSRQYELEYYRYYGLPNYWDGAGMWGLGGFPEMSSPLSIEPQVVPVHTHRADKHLQSARAVENYRIHAVDGMLGKVSGFKVDDKSWAIREMLVETGHWYSGKEIALSTSQVERVSYDESSVFVSVTQEEIRSTPENQVVHAEVTPRAAGDFPTE